MMAEIYERERFIAELAVQRASILTKRVFAEVDKGVLSKDDSSPVTIADFASQALLIGAIHHNFPSDKFVAEEAADALRKDLELQSKVWHLVATTHLDDRDYENLLSTPSSANDMLDIIDLGCGSGGAKGRVWMLDPVDGTATFLRGEQYAICLALVEDGQEKVGVLGCPNLKLEDGKIRETCVDKAGYGLMLSAVRSQGAAMRQMARGALQPACKIGRKSHIPTSQDLQFTDTKIGTSMSLEKHRKIAVRLGASWPGTELWSSQMRYVALAVGSCDIMLRIPQSMNRRSYVWDHAGGHLLLEEVGGKVIDLNGKDLNFGAGRRLQDNYGMIAAPLGMHAELIKMVKELD